MCLVDFLVDFLGGKTGVVCSESALKKNPQKINQKPTENPQQKNEIHGQVKNNSAQKSTAKSALKLQAKVRLCSNQEYTKSIITCMYYISTCIQTAITHIATTSGLPYLVAA